MNSSSKLAYLILTLSVVYAFAYPLFGEISSLLEEKQRHKVSLETFANMENRKDELLTKFNNMPASLKKDIETILPDSMNFVRLISQIDAVASKYGILIDKTSYQETSPSVGESIAEAQPEKLYRSAIIAFSFLSSYENFRKFMDDLEKSLRILDIRSVKLVSQEGGMYQYDVEFETYWLND